VTDSDERPETNQTSTLQTQPGRKKVRELTTKELAEAAGTEKGLRLRMVLTELGKRDGDDAINALGSAASTRELEPQKLARALLGEQLEKLDSAALKEKLKDDRIEIKLAAIRVAGNRSLRTAEALIQLLPDHDDSVRQAARNSLKRLSGDKDFGPQPDASETDRERATQEWRAWLRTQSGQ